MKAKHGKTIGIILVVVLLLCCAFFSCRWVWINHIKPYHDSDRMVQAIQENDLDVVKEMLDSGISPNVPSGPYDGIWRYVNSFVEYSPDYPLSKACLTGNLEVVQLLLDYGADPALTEQEGIGWSALSSTILGSRNEDCVEIAKLLIAHGADPTSDCDGYLPVFLASREYPTSGEPGSQERTAHAGRIVALVDLLIGDMDVNQSDGYTLLINAALHGNLPLVEYLLSAGADPGIQTSDGSTAYDFAMLWDHNEIAEVLKAAGEEQ